MPKRRELNENLLTGWQYKKLSKLRKSVGKRVADTAFIRWLKQEGTTEPIDHNATAIRNAVDALVRSGQARIPHGGYVLRRGRGRIVVEPLKREKQKYDSKNRKRNKLEEGSEGGDS